MNQKFLETYNFIRQANKNYVYINVIGLFEWLECQNYNDISKEILLAMWNAFELRYFIVTYIKVATKINTPVINTNLNTDLCKYLFAMPTDKLTIEQLALLWDNISLMTQYPVNQPRKL